MECPQFGKPGEIVNETAVGNLLSSLISVIPSSAERVAAGSSNRSSGCTVWAPKSAGFWGLADRAPPPAPGPGWSLSLLLHLAFHQSGWKHIRGSSNWHYYYCDERCYILSACICQALCLHDLTPLHSPIKLSAGWCGLCLSVSLEHFLDNGGHV